MGGQSGSQSGLPRSGVRLASVFRSGQRAKELLKLKGGRQRTSHSSPGCTDSLQSVSKRQTLQGQERGN